MMNESDSALENHSSDDEKTIVETTINIQHRKLNMSTSDPTRTKNMITKLNSQKRLIKKKKNIQKWKKSDSIESTDYYESSSSTENDSLDEGSNDDDDDDDDPFDPTKNPSCQIPEFSLRGFQAPKYRTVLQKRRNNNFNDTRPRFFSDGFFEQPGKSTYTGFQDQGNESKSDNNMNMNKQVYKSKNLIPRDPIDVTRNFFVKSLVEARTSLERSFGLF